MEHDSLNEFSSAFSVALFERHPAWLEFGRVDESAEQPGSLIVEVPSPAESDPQDLWILTDEDEVTVGFDRYHWHFNDYDATDAELFNQVLAFVEDILEERTIIGVVMEGDRWRSAEALKLGAEFVVPEGYVGYLRSWRGSHNVDGIECGINVVGGGRLSVHELSSEQVWPSVYNPGYDETNE